MNKNRIFGIIVLPLLSSIALAQSDFRPGYYIDKNLDTIRGLINFRGDIRNSKQCVFKKEGSSEESIFTPSDINAYRFIDSKFYISKTISLKSVEKKVFLEYVLNGIVDLYYYKDEATKERYYLETKNGRLVELKNDVSEVLVDGRVKGVQENKKHIGVLKVAFSDCEQIQSSIEQTKLNHKSLINISRKYHNYICDGEKCIIYEKKPKKFRLTLAPFLGYGFTNLSIEDNYNIINGDYGTIALPFAGISFNLVLPENLNKFSLQLSSEISQVNFHSSTPQNYSSSIYTDIRAHTKVESAVLISSLSLKYTYPKGKIRPTVAIGGAWKRFLNDNSRSYLSYVLPSSSFDSNMEIALDDKYFGIFVQIGCDFNITKKLTAFSNIKYYSFSSGKAVGASYKMYYRENNTEFKTFNLSLGIYF